MVVAPSLPENLALIIDLLRQVIPELSKSILEFFLEGVECIMNIFHGKLRLLFVLLDLTKGI